MIVEKIARLDEVRELVEQIRGMLRNPLMFENNKETLELRQALHLKRFKLMLEECELQEEIEAYDRYMMKDLDLPFQEEWEHDHYNPEDERLFESGILMICRM